MDSRNRLESLLHERIAVLDGSWGVLIQRRVKGEEAYRGERFAGHPKDVAGNPDLLNVLIVVPERMSAWKLYKYQQHLAGNRQKTERYEIALWKKLLYPFATLVMMALVMALHAGSGG